MGRRTMRVRLYELRRASEAADLAVARIRDVAEDALVRVVGRIVGAGELVVSPATGETAVWLRTRCLVGSTYRDTADDADTAVGWEVVFDDVAGARFEIEDDSGRAIVVAAGAHIAVDEVDVSARFAGSSGGEELREHLSRSGVPFSWKLVRVLESTLRVGDVVELLGCATTTLADAAGYRVAAGWTPVFGGGGEDAPVLSVRKIGAATTTE